MQEGQYSNGNARQGPESNAMIQKSMVKQRQFKVSSTFCADSKTCRSSMQVSKSHTDSTLQTKGAQVRLLTSKVSYTSLTARL